MAVEVGHLIPAPAAVPVVVQEDETGHAQCPCCGQVLDVTPAAGPTTLGREARRLLGQLPAPE